MIYGRKIRLGSERFWDCWMRKCNQSIKRDSYLQSRVRNVIFGKHFPDSLPPPHFFTCRFAFYYYSHPLTDPNFKQDFTAFFSFPKWLFFFCCLLTHTQTNIYVKRFLSKLNCTKYIPYPSLLELLIIIKGKSSQCCNKNVL